MKSIGYYNGTFGPPDDMSIPMNDRAVYFGDGVFDVSYGENRRLLFLDDHVDRFFSSMQLIEIPFTMSKEELKQIINQMMERLDSDEGFLLYWQASRGSAPRSHIYPPDVSPNLMMTLRPFTIERKKDKYRLITMEDTRFLHCNIKTLNLIPNLMATQRASEAGCQEAVFHRNGRVTECSHSNLFIIKDGVVITAPADNLILPGITRKHILNICKELNIPFEEREYYLEEMMGADEVIVSSTGAVVAPVSHIDNIPVGGRAPELVKRLDEALWKEIDAELSK